MSIKDIKVSVIIVAYNNHQELDDCLKSIQTYNDVGEKLEVIIVDNSTTDSVEKIVRNYNKIKYVKNPDNGFGRGNNIGANCSSGDLLIFLNPDTLLIEPIFREIIKLYYSKSNCGMAGVQLLNEKRVEHNSYNMRLNYGVYKKILLYIFRKFHLFFQKYMYTSGADIIMDRETFYSIGGFDEGIFMYGEEQDLAHRVNDIGKRLYYFPKLKIVHLQGKSTGKNYASTHGRMNTSNEIYCNKYGYDYKKELRKEIKAMRMINSILKKAGKKKYEEDLINYYESFL